MTLTKQTYQVFDKLSPSQYQALREDIKQRGIQVPVEKDEDGNTLDGHHREEIAKELGIPCPEVVRKFATENDKRIHVIMLNLGRRHLSPQDWTIAFSELLNEKGVKLGRGARNDKGETSVSFTEVAKEVGVNVETAKKRLQKAKKDLPSAIRKRVENNEITLKDGLAEAKSNEAPKAEEDKEDKPSVQTRKILLTVPQLKLLKTLATRALDTQEFASSQNRLKQIIQELKASIAKFK
jgi:hypothetical protein